MRVINAGLRIMCTLQLELGQVHPIGYFILHHLSLHDNLDLCRLPFHTVAAQVLRIVSKTTKKEWVSIPIVPLFINETVEDEDRWHSARSARPCIVWYSTKLASRRQCLWQWWLVHRSSLSVHFSIRFFSDSRSHPQIGISKDCTPTRYHGNHSLASRFRLFLKLLGEFYNEC